MKAPISFAAIALSVLAMPALAQETPTPTPSPTINPVATANFPVTGDVPQLCVLGDPRFDNGQVSTNIAALVGRIVRIDKLVDPQTLSTRGTRAVIAVDAMCNYPFRVTVESENNGLWRQTTTTPTPAGFANAVPYLADLSWSDDGVRLDADATSRKPATAGFSSSIANSGQLTLALQILPGSTNALSQAPLVAGDYRDTITITVGPQ